MQKTTATTESDASDKRASDRDESARAKAYLDLWERHLVVSAGDTRISNGRPPG